MNYIQRAGLQASEVLDRSLNRLFPQQIPDLRTCDLVIPSSDPFRSIELSYYGPKFKHRPFPVLVHFHGTADGLSTHPADHKDFPRPRYGPVHRDPNSFFCRSVADATLFAVFEVPCRATAEKPAAAMMSDVQDVLRHIESCSKDYDSGRICVSGFGAGVKLALLAVKSSPRWFGRQIVQTCIALDPPAELGVSAELELLPGMPEFQVPATVQRTWSWCYVPDLKGRTDLSDHWPETFPAEKRKLERLLAVVCVNEEIEKRLSAVTEKVQEELPREPILRRVGGDEFGTSVLATQSWARPTALDEAYAIVSEVLWSVR